MEIGDKIKNLRIKNALTQEELANRCELTKGFISQLERDLTSPSIATLMDILEGLGTNLKDFFNEITDEKIVFTKEDAFIKDNDLHMGNLKHRVKKGESFYYKPGVAHYLSNPGNSKAFVLWVSTPPIF